MSLSKLQRSCFIDLPAPSMRTSCVTSFYDDPDNPDNKGYWRCRYCYSRFPSKMNKEQMSEHLKSHPKNWKRFMENIEHSMDRQLNYREQIHDDERKTNDLKLSVGLMTDDRNIVLRLPKSRVSRRRFKSNCQDGPDTFDWNKVIAEEYQNNPVGGYQGNFDKPICEKEIEFLHCGNWLISFQDFVSYRHEPESCCSIFDINRKKYSGLENKDKIDAYFISGKPIKVNFGPSSSIVDQSVTYTCIKNMCVFPCLCQICVLDKNQCNKHSILHPGYFEAKNDWYTVRNGDSFNINVNDWKKCSSNIYKYAGIPRSCLECTDNVFHHQAFHFVYHNSCKFCRASRYRFDGVRTQEHFVRRLQILEDREELSCHICYDIFSTGQDKNRHIDIVHFKDVKKQYSCSQCNHIVYSKQALFYHTERQHNKDNKTLRFQCDYCDKKFHVKHSLNVHVRYAHEFDQVKCDYCSETFKKQSNLNSHMKYVHDIFCNKILLDDECEIAFFDCDDCSFQSRYEKHLRRHIATVHTKGPIMSCTQCNFETIYMANLQSHIKKIHLKDGQFSCDQCSFKTIYMRNLKTHIEGIHETKENFKCPDCSFSSVYKRSLTRHLKEIHGIHK